MQLEFNFNQNPKVQGLINRLMQLSPDLRFVGNITAEMYANNYFGLPTQHIDLPGQEKALVIPTGSKIMRMLQKICKAFNTSKEHGNAADKSYKSVKENNLSVVKFLFNLRNKKICNKA